ncbi:MAG TPA: alpha/beta fold hydrolase [Burkholderiaceae bacterium]|nr:alpha/beta fold hydrolase [Burkholderiaceae bacterium]
MPIAEANGLQLHYEVAGDPAAPPVVLIMGLGMPAAAWPEGLVAYLVRHGLRVIRFDNRDAGTSTHFAASPSMPVPLAIGRALLRLPVRAPYRLEDMADDTEALLDALAIDRAHIVGASMGGMIGQVLAARAPRRVASLTSIMSATGNPHVGLGRPRAIRAVLTRPKQPRDPVAMIEHYMRVFGVIGSGGEFANEAALRAQVERIVQAGAYDGAAATRQILAILASGDRRGSLAHIRAPTLVIHGADDPLLPVGAGRETARCIPGARLLVIPGMAHDLPLALLPRLADQIADHCHAAGI